MNKLSKSLIILGVAILSYIGSIFGTSILGNLHNRYLRGLGDNVVLIHNIAGSGATGFIVKGKSGKFYTMTNNHVCELEKSGTMLGNYQDDTYVLKVIKRYPMNDLCVMSAPKTANHAFKIAKSYDLGQTAYAIGHPQLEPLSVSTGELSDEILVTVVVGYNVAPESCTGPTYELQTDLGPQAMFFGIVNACVRSIQGNTSSIIIAPGNSGSPIVDVWGSVVGVAFAANEYGTRSYIVPLRDLQAFLKDL